MSSKGFLADLQRASRRAAADAQRRQNAANRQHQAAIREAEQARKANERAQAQFARASEADRKRLEKEAQAAHVAAMEADAAQQNAELEEVYGEIDGLLQATLSVDDYVDLESLRRTVEHPAFDRTDLEQPTPPPPPVIEPPEPVYVVPTPPGGLIGRKKKVADAEAAAQAAHAEAHEAWQAAMAQVPAQRQLVEEQHAHVDQQRAAHLAQERTRYQAECEARDSEVAQHNESIDTLIANLGYGTVDAVQEYVSIVLSNSVYPDVFEVRHDFEFEPTTAELTIRVLIPGPGTLPTIKAYKYTKASDEITSTGLSQKAQKDRYSSAVHQVALRTLHEVFEADRRGLIKSISLDVGSETNDPATGKFTYIPFVAVAAGRDAFLEFDLAEVVPSATLTHLGAALSKNPHGLTPAAGAGIRRS